MTRELFVSTTPHETKVGLVEDDLLAEIYLERENEYTLAGSIYKGRVSRVLPGMQSAFVDIGLERDAFLYVSDFMDLQDEDEVEELPTNAVPAQPYQSPAKNEAQVPDVAMENASPVGEHPVEEQVASGARPVENRVESGASGSREGGRGDWRSRRRRGRRGERMPESKFARSSTESPRTDRPERTERPERSERSDYGPPPGYQPILLPGESISKYQRLAQNQRAGSQASSSSSDASTPLTAAFPEDEPFFAKPEVEQTPATPEPQDKARGAAANARVGSREWDREQKRLHEMNVAAVFGEPGVQPSENREGSQSEQLAAAFVETDPAVPQVAQTIVEEEIEEEETDLTSYVEDLEEDAVFEEEELEKRRTTLKTIARPPGKSPPPARLPQAPLRMCLQRPL